MTSGTVRSPRVEVPAPGSDRPALGRVGLIAGIGFVIGVVWPRLAGVTLVPEAPTETPIAATSAGPAEAEPAPVATATAPEPAPAATPPKAPSRIKVARPTITSCRDTSGKKFTHCGELSADAIPAALEALGSCSGAERVVGTLSLGFDLDFQTGRVKEIHAGRSTTLSEANTRLLLACAERALAPVSLAEVKRQHARYTVYYMIELLDVAQAPAATSEAPPAPDATPASGVATVAWDAALVRKTPRDGEVVARILAGTRVTVTGRRGDWYRIRYDAKGSEGWVYRAAIGL